ncbi:hypothetical protein [Streptomyces sp. NPDC046161]|uniref:hypothetical protein n=1 Tax=Streptomyces sp. NPDC046161 TaxID=3155132 RepID=UPI0033DF35CB
MTAPARPVPRTDRPPTREQLLVLADRAERGQLTAAEAARLRQGIANAFTRRRSAAGNAALETRRYREACRKLLAVEALMQRARRQGTRSVRLQTLTVVLQVESQLPPPRGR